MESTGGNRANAYGAIDPPVTGPWWSRLCCSLGLHRWEALAEPVQPEATHFSPYRKQRCRRCRKVTQVYSGWRYPRGTIGGCPVNDDHV